MVCGVSTTKSGRRGARCTALVEMADHCNDHPAANSHPPVDFARGYIGTGYDSVYHRFCLSPYCISGKPPCQDEPGRGLAASMVRPRRVHSDLIRRIATDCWTL